MDLWTLPLTLNEIATTTPVEVKISPNSAPCNPVVEAASLSYACTNKTNKLNLHTKAYATPPLHPSSGQSMLGSSRVPCTWTCTQYKNISLPVQPPQKDI